MIRNMSQAFVIAEYQPFNHTDQVLSILLHSSAVSNCSLLQDTMEEFCSYHSKSHTEFKGKACTPPDFSEAVSNGAVRSENPLYCVLLQKRLYVNSQSELVQLNVANCAKYGDKCEDCVLARDPYCGWKDGHCTSETE